ncbi:hypothetical protein RhiirA4_471473 [Rhizophagus irregularis]|uniref:Uncharacterized protein n=1 Tax=Rhizophagus irregularis TaxID=588596 RepID=A0A2I1H381_9GLOM|nr:hypothetical protein RhiirA4_471473 [Rhizophagus irregularis]
MGGGKNSSQILIGQFSNYRNRKAPYDHQFIDEIYTVQNWWSMTYEENDEKNYIQDLAFKIFSIRPHNAGLKEEFGDEDSDVSEVEDENDINNNNNGIDEYLNLASEELRQLLEVQVVEVRIEKQPVDHGEKDFDINALLQEEFDQN